VLPTYHPYLFNICVLIVTGNNKTMRMLEVPENKTSLKIDQQIVLSNKYLSEQIGGGQLYKLVSKSNLKQS
jgi:hypothetical protein